MVYSWFSDLPVCWKLLNSWTGNPKSRCFQSRHFAVLQSASFYINWHVISFGVIYSGCELLQPKKYTQQFKQFDLESSATVCLQAVGYVIWNDQMVVEYARNVRSFRLYGGNGRVTLEVLSILIITNWFQWLYSATGPSMFIATNLSRHLAKKSFRCHFCVFLEYSCAFHLPFTVLYTSLPFCT